MRCKAINRVNKQPCKNSAVYKGYCLKHVKIKQKEVNENERTN